MTRIANCLTALVFLMTFTLTNSMANESLDSLLNYPSTVTSMEDEREWEILKYCSNYDPHAAFVGNLDCIESFMDFLEEHPNTSLLEEVYLEMIKHYQYLECSEEEKSWAYLKAIYYCNLLIENHTAFAADHYLSNRLVGLMHLLDNEMWNLSIDLVKSDLIPEKIMINIDLLRKSNSTKARAIAMSTAKPSYDIYLFKDGKPVGKDDGLIYEFSLGEFSEKESVVLKPGEVSSQGLDMNDWLPVDETFAPGNYEVQVKRSFLHAQPVKSNTLKFTIQ